MKKIYFTILCVAILIAACRKTEVVETVETKPKTAKGIELGKKLENPYSVKNMRKAYKNLTSGTNSVQDDPIYTTHYYVRFLPADTAQYNKLKNDTTLRMYPYPLDYEISETGDDFGGDQDTPVWQYAAVKNDYQFDSNIETEVLEELYIPDDDYNPNDEVFTNGNSQTAFNRKLVDEAMRITNNLDYVSTKTNVKGSNGTQANQNVQVAWNPQGTIRVFDTRLNQYIPLVGVKVSARRWFTTRETYTNANGQYWLGSFSGPANYAVWYETGDFDIRSGWFGQAWYNGPKRNTPWNLDISGDVQRFYAHVFRGVRRFFYGNTGGLRRPNTSFFKGKIKYAARNSVGSQQGINYTTATQGGIFPDIQIWRYNSSREYASDEIFSTAVHETAHTTHMNSMNGPFELIQYFQVAKVIQESWPIAVEWQVTQMEYQERGISNYSNPFYSVSASYPIDRAYQYWTPAVSADYTSLFIDIIDSHNQNSTNSAVIDNVNGYTLAYIESNLLKHIYGKSSLAAQLKTSKPYGVTDRDIDVLIFGGSASGLLSSVVGIDIGVDDAVYYWQNNGVVRKGNSTSLGTLSYSYVLPSGKSFSHVVDMAISNSGKGYVWYADGTVSVGYGLYNFGDFILPKSYLLPYGKIPSDIAGIAIRKSDDRCFAFYKDGTYSQGNSTNLGAYVSPQPYTVAPGEGYGTIKDIGIAATSGKFYVWYVDDKVSVGHDATDLDNFIALKPVYN